MSTQIAVRLPDAVVAFLDNAVAQGKATSRGALVSSALEREMRRQAADADAATLRQRGPADDLDALVDWSVGHLDAAGACSTRPGRGLRSDGSCTRDTGAPSALR